MPMPKPMRMQKPMPTRMQMQMQMPLQMRMPSPSPRHAPGFLLLLALAVLATGCADLLKLLQGGGFQTPALTFQRAVLRDLALDRATLDVVFRVDNPNSVGIDLASVAYELKIEGRSLVSGRPEKGLQIPASGSAEVVFPGSVRFTDLAEGLQAALAKKAVHWRASGEAGVNTPIGIVALPLAAEGDVALPTLPTVTLEAPRVVSLGFTGAKLVFPLQIENPNDFPLPAPALSGSLSLAGVHVGQAHGGGEAVAARGRHKVEVALDIGFLSAGAAVAQAIADGRAEVALAGLLDVGGVKVPVSARQSFTLEK